MYKTLSAPLVAQVEISGRCPNRCLHCYNFWRQNKELILPADLSINAIDRVMSQLINYRIFHAVLTGGEPFLNKTVLFRALERASSGSITININSSLVTLTVEDVKRLKKLGISRILTSIMGPNAEVHDNIAQRPGAFQETVRGIRLLQEAEVPVDVNMVISQKNKSFLRETVRFVKFLGIKHFNSTRAGCPGSCCDFSELSLTIQDFRDYLAELRDIGEEEQMQVGVLESYPLCAMKEAKRFKAFTGRRCLAGVTTITVAADGYVRPCSHLDISYGNLLKEDLNDIWNRMQEWRNGSFIPEICKSCKVLPWCGGGCRMEAKMRNGSLDAVDPYIEPDDIDFTFSELKAIKKQELAALPTAFQLNPKIKWRTEDFGGVVFIGQRFVCYLNNSALKLLEGLSFDRSYQLSDFADQFTGDNGSFAQKLYNKKIFISVNSQKGGEI